MNQQSGRTKSTAIILVLFLGGIGGHKFYLGQTAWGFMYLLFFWTFIPVGVAVLELILLVVMSEDTFNRRFNAGMSFEPTRACPYCAEHIKLVAVTCRFCRKELR